MAGFILTFYIAICVVISLWRMSTRIYKAILELLDINKKLALEISSSLIFTSCIIFIAIVVLFLLYFLCEVLILTV